MKDVREVLVTMQKLFPTVAGVVKIKSYYKVLSQLDDMEYVLWVLRNHGNSFLMIDEIHTRYQNILENPTEFIKPGRGPVSFRNIGKMLGISEKKTRCLYSEVSDKIITLTTRELNQLAQGELTVFLGGTCNGSTWRDELVKQLNVTYFNPVVRDWDEEAQKREEDAKLNAKYNLYVITPKMEGVYSIAELVSDSYTKPDKTLVCFLKEDDNEAFEEHEWKSLKATEKLILKNGALVFDSLEDIAKFLNKN